MSLSTGLPLAQLSVALDDFFVALRSFKRLHHGATKTLDAILSFSNGELEIELGGIAVTVDAGGDWRGECRVAGAWILGLQAAPPTADPVVLRVEAGRLHIGSTSAACHWQAAGAAQVTIPIGADFRVSGA